MSSSRTINNVPEATKSGDLDELKWVASMDSWRREEDSFDFSIEAGDHKGFCRKGREDETI